MNAQDHHEQVAASNVAAARGVIFDYFDYFDYFDCCAGWSEDQALHAAKNIVAALVHAGLIQQLIEQHYSAAEVAKLLSRSDEYITQQIKAGHLAPVARDGGGWLVPASSIAAWLAARSFDVAKNSPISSTVNLLNRSRRG